MQSIREPELSSNSVRILACKNYCLNLIPGQRLRFLLVANPVKTISDETGRKKADGEIKKCRVPLIREDEQKAWVECKLQDAALLEILVVDTLFPLRFKKRKENRAGKIQPVSFRGILTVENPGAMTALIQNGIGPAKAFGCGLLSLANS